jgi:hypothetical protein
VLQDVGENGGVGRRERGKTQRRAKPAAHITPLSEAAALR